jgi:hypothetical protein
MFKNKQLVHAHVNFVIHDPALTMSKQTWKFMNMAASMPKQMYTGTYLNMSMFRQKRTHLIMPTFVYI